MPQDITLEHATQVALHGLDVCPECASVYHKTRRDRVFCSNECRKAHHARNAAYGAQLFALCMDWRLSRGKKKLGDVTALIDSWLPAYRDRDRKYQEAKAKLQEVIK